MTDSIAVQLYTLRHLSTDPHELVRVAAEAGYDGVEGVHDPAVDPDALRATLVRHGLSMASAHVPLETLESDLDGVLRAQRKLGNRTLVLPWLDRELYDRTAASWRALGERFARIAARCREHEATLLYHNHDFELVAIDGRLALDHLLDTADGVGLELDLGWCAAAGVDPLPLIRRHADRLARVHLKDRAPEGENADQDGWADVGHGVIDWPPLLAAARAAGVDWFVVEHDNPADPAASIRRSLDYLRGLP